MVNRKYNVLILLAVFLNVLMLLGIFFFYLIVCLKYLVWGIYSIENIENGLEPFSMLDLGEKYYGSSIYQIWLDELSKPSEMGEKRKLDKKEGYLSDEAFPYLTYRSNPDEIRAFYDKVIKFYLSSNKGEEFERKLEGALSDYLKGEKLMVPKDGVYSPDYYKDHFFSIPVRNWTELRPVPDIDLREILKFKELVEHRNSFLLKMDMQKIDVEKKEKDFFFSTKRNPAYFMVIPYWDRKLGEKFRRLEEGYRYGYNRLREKEYYLKKKYSPLMAYYMEDGAGRTRFGNYYLKEEYRKTFPDFRAIDRPDLYIAYRLPRRVGKVFFEFYRRTWLDRNLVHTSNYMEPVADYQQKIRYRVLDYYLERAERKYFYQMMSSLPSIYQSYELQKFRKGNKHVPRWKRRREAEMGHDPVRRVKMAMVELKRERYKKGRRTGRLTWLRRMKRYSMAEFSSHMKLKKKLRLAVEFPKERNKARGVIFGTRFDFKTKKIAIDDRSVHYKVARLKGAYPRLYVNELVPGFGLYRDKQFLLPGDGKEFPRKAYERLRRAFYVLHLEFLQRDRGFEDYSTYEKFLFRKCYQYRTLGKSAWNASYPVMWPAYQSPYGRSVYFWKDYLPAPYWRAETGSLQRLRYDRKEVPSKSLRREWWTGRLRKGFWEKVYRARLLKFRNSPLKISKGVYWTNRKEWMKNFKPLMWLSRSRQKKLRMVRRVEHIWTVLGPRLEEGERRFGKKKWFTSFSIPAYKDLNLYWIFYYGIKGFWMETHFSTYIKVLGSAFVYWIAMVVSKVVASDFFWLGWFFLLLGTFAVIIYLIRMKEDWMESLKVAIEVDEEDFAYWFFKTNYKYKDIDWSGVGKGFRFSNFYLFDRIYYNVYGKSLYQFLKFYEGDLDLSFKAMIRFLTFLLFLNFVIGGGVYLVLWVFGLGVGV